MANNKALVDGIVECLGGAENIASCYHCATRLRFELKDWGLVKNDQLDKVKGVIGKSMAGDQLQLIIGPGVAEVYDELCSTYNISKQAAIDENLDTKGALTFRKVLNNIVTAIADSFIPIIPAIVASSFISLIPTVFGPGMLNVLPAESDLYRLFTFIGNVGFYFLPVFMGMTAAKKFGCSQVLGVFIGCMMLHPTLIEIVNSGVPFKVYGIPMTAVSYASSTIPALLSVWIMSYIEKFIHDHIPNALRMVFVPLLTILIMIPIVLCIVGPLGTLIGNVLAGVFVAVGNMGRIPAIIMGTIIGGIFIFAIMFGMHIPLFMIALGIMAENGGADALILPGMMTCVFGLLGMEIGALLKAKNPENRALVASYLITHAVGGITEPALFGVGIRYKKPIICSCIGSAVGSFFLALTNTAVYTVVASSNLLAVTAFAGGPASNFTMGLIGLGICVVVGAVLTFLFGFTDEKDF